MSKSLAFLIAAGLCFVPLIGEVAAIMSLLHRGYKLKACLWFFAPVALMWVFFGILYGIHLQKNKNRLQ